MVVAFNVLFYVFKILSIELHRKKGNDFYSMCPTCTEGWLMKMKRQSVIESIREYIPLNDCLIDFDEDPLRFEHFFQVLSCLLIHNLKIVILYMAT